MAFVSEWERLSEALRRVMAANELAEEEAQRDICRAIADQAVNIRGKLRKHVTKNLTSDAVLEGKDFHIPAEIRSEQLDWDRSRPLKPWVVRPESFRVPGNWELDRIELFRAHVTKVLCRAEKARETTKKASKKGGARNRSRPASKAAQEAIKELFPQRVPGQSILRNKMLCRQVSEKLREKGLPGVSPDTILRAAGRRK
jgi:hypothetical protein